MRRKVSTIIVLLFFALLCAGCAPDRAEEKRLVVWHVGSESQARSIMEISRDFTEKTGVEVLCEAISWGNAHSKYLTSIAGEVTPDIGSMGLTWGMEFGEKGAMVDLRSAFPQDLAALEKKIFPGLLYSTQVGDKVFGVPFDFSEQIIYYRKDIVPEPPRTWEEMLSLLKDLRSKGKGIVLDWGSLEWIGYSPFLWQAGGDYYNAQKTRVMLDTEEAARALAFMTELYANGMPRTYVPLEQALRTGDYPLAISGNWKIVSLSLGAPEIDGKWSIAMLPRGPSGKRTAFIGGRLFGIFERSNKKKEAWEFIKFLFQPENQIRIYKASLETEDAYLPPNMDAWKDLPMDEDFKDVLIRQARDAKGPPPVLAWDSSTRFVNQAIQMSVLKKADPAAELKKAAKEMQMELDGLNQF